MMNSNDGETYNIYYSQMMVNDINPVTIHTIVDNNVGIRSGLYKKTLLIPSAASVSIRGRISNGNRGITATLKLARINYGEVITIRTNPFGYYRFDNLQVGEDYVLNPTSKKYQFNPANKLVSLTQDLNNQDFQVSTDGGQQ